MAGFAADQDASHRTGIADAQRGRAALDLCRRRVGQIGQMSLAGVHDQDAGRRAPHSAPPQSVATARASCETSLPSDSPKPPGSRKSRCMSMIKSAVVDQSRSIGGGSAATVPLVGYSCLLRPPSRNALINEARPVPLCTTVREAALE